ncbi:PGPGW domain-containing protein [Halofilum ochraceum]|uniref:PGPGW domain-containing protein n=1 Tax=Halofilum ochraceum TaxID=1611323 RepID=UPI0009F71CE0|nr:PGPGW domain-containing protein [Halofilum ochraceum]
MVPDSDDERSKPLKRALDPVVPAGAPSLFLRLARGSYRIARRLVIATVGTTVVLVGAVMFFTPGPAVVVIPLGLAILALEFVWARRLLRLFRVRARQAARAYRRGDRGYWRRWLWPR